MASLAQLAQVEVSVDAVEHGVGRTGSSVKGSDPGARDRASTIAVQDPGSHLTIGRLRRPPTGERQGGLEDAAPGDSALDCVITTW
jgi:hypothetical protein